MKYKIFRFESVDYNPNCGVSTYTKLILVEIDLSIFEEKDNSFDTVEEAIKFVSEYKKAYKYNFTVLPVV